MFIRALTVTYLHVGNIETGCLGDLKSLILYLGLFDIMKLKKIFITKFSSVRSVMSDSLCTHGLQHGRPPCPSPTPRARSNSCPLCQGCHPTISSSVITFSSSLQSFPTSRSFQMSQVFASGGQSIGVLASTSVLPKNNQD